MTAKHPAKFSDSILEVLDQELPLDGLGLDPFAGVGRIHELGRNTIGVEIEPEWASQHPQNICADSTRLPFRIGSFDWAVTSVTYGNRMADHHDAKDMHKPCGGRGCSKCWYRGVTLRHTYTHYLGHKLHRNNSGAMPWGTKYFAFHEDIYAELDRVLNPDPDTMFVLNTKDFYRKKKLVEVWKFHKFVLEARDFELIKHVKVPTPGQRHGTNRDLRVDEEDVMVFVR